jgi:nucleoside-diphosphate-sugar epimerase
MLEIIKNDTDKIQIDLSKLRNKTILITGASGLIGIYLLGYLKKYQEEYNITIHTWNRRPITDTVFEPMFSYCHTMIGDITDKSLFDNLPMFDFIIHAAGYGQPIKFSQNKLKTIELNTLSTIWLFEKLKENGTFLFVSTSELYSGLENYNISESQIGTTTPTHPRASYIEGKRCGETICHSYREQGVDVKIIRLSLAYGPGTQENDTRVINSLIEKAIKNDSINLMDGGQAIRTYCYISDVTEMLYNVLLFGKEHTYNVGGLTASTILEVANMIGQIYNKKVITPTIENELSGNPKIVNISIEKYLNEFKKENFITLIEGLNNTIKWQTKLYETRKNNQ